LSNKEIAHQLEINHGTVKQHMHKIFQKLGVKRVLKGGLK
jgi:ATP/maltotriose-dependent transcriptional regulator MalT